LYILKLNNILSKSPSIVLECFELWNFALVESVLQVLFVFVSIDAINVYHTVTVVHLLNVRQFETWAYIAHKVDLNGGL